jgi:hypothetical protein
MRCSVYLINDQRCGERATYWLIQDDGRRNPGGHVCERHGRSIVAEYQAKLGEIWRLEPFSDAERGLP